MALSPKILGLGAIAVDEISYVDQPLSSGKGKIVHRVVAHGGNIATALVAAAKLGSGAGYIGWLGGSSDRDSSARNLKDFNVDIGHAPICSEFRPVFSKITVGNDGDRFIAFDDEGMSREVPCPPDRFWQAGQILLVDSYAAASLDLVESAKRSGVLISGDIERYQGAATDRLMALCDHLVLPLEFASRLTSENQPADIIGASCFTSRQTVILTNGEAGLYCREAGGARVKHFAAFETTVVDTTGAGDCFHGAYAYALSSGYGFDDCILFASAAAALSVAGFGARDSLPGFGAVSGLRSTFSA